MNIHTRWMIRIDFDAVLDIERHSFQSPWTSDEFLGYLSNRNIIAKVAEVDEKVVGFCVYELNGTYFWLMNVAVHKDWRQKGVGSHLLHDLSRKLSPLNRRTIRCKVRESNLIAQLWLARNGFKATSISRGEFDDCDEDAIHFTHRIQQMAEVAQ
jgi:ribosomal-protein-alanine N-acetyltransferase